MKKNSLFRITETYSIYSTTSLHVPSCLITFANSVWRTHQYDEIDYRSSHSHLDSMGPGNRLHSVNISASRAPCDKPWWVIIHSWRVWCHAPAFYTHERTWHRTYVAKLYPLQWYVWCYFFLKSTQLCYNSRYNVDCEMHIHFRANRTPWVTLSGCVTQMNPISKRCDISPKFSTLSVCN